MPTLQTLLVDANPMDITFIRWLRPSRDVIPHTQYSSINTTNGTVYTVTPSHPIQWRCLRM